MIASRYATRTRKEKKWKLFSAHLCRAAVRDAMIAHLIRISDHRAGRASNRPLSPSCPDRVERS
ncbi:MAG TPA: hypothetical protein VFR86_11080, partial [Burkholderiaceae bacterium]|nr:hypothetical protein [Burkholderiaceae bacterium]